MWIGVAGQQHDFFVDVINGWPIYTWNFGHSPLLAAIRPKPNFWTLLTHLRTQKRPYKNLGKNVYTGTLQIIGYQRNKRTGIPNSCLYESGFSQTIIAKVKVQISG